MTIKKYHIETESFISDYDFGVPICKANFKNVGSLEVTINEIQ